MSYLLDTDICIYWLKGHEQVKENLLRVTWMQVSVSVITRAELYYGAFNSNYVQNNLERAQLFLRQFPVLPLSDDILRQFGALKTTLRKSGQLLPDFDLLIASTALAEDKILVTNNIRHYQRIPNLKLENWVTAP